MILPGSRIFVSFLSGDTTYYVTRIVAFNIQIYFIKITSFSFIFLCHPDRGVPNFEIISTMSTLAAFLQTKPAHCNK